MLRRPLLFDVETSSFTSLRCAFVRHTEVHASVAFPASTFSPWCLYSSRTLHRVPCKFHVRCSVNIFPGVKKYLDARSLIVSSYLRTLTLPAESRIKYNFGVIYISHYEQNEGGFALRHIIIMVTSTNRVTIVRLNP